MLEQQLSDEEKARLTVAAAAPEYTPIQTDELVEEYSAESPLYEERHWYTGWNVIYQGTFAGFIWMARFLNAKVKYYMATASLPVEIINFFIVMKKVVGREKPAAIFVGIVLPLIALITTMVLVDLVRFGVITSGPLAAIAGAGPFIFTGALAVFGALNLLRMIETASECHAAYKNGTLTPLHKMRLGSRITKTAALFALAGLIAPFMFATVANPFGAILFGAAITAVLLTVVVMKVVKTIVENREWKKTLAELDMDENNEDPYEALNVDRDYLQTLIDAKNTESGLTKLKHMFKPVKNLFLKLFGSDEQKAKAAHAHTPSSYIRQCLAERIAAGGDPAKLSRYCELIRKQRGREVFSEYRWKKTMTELNGQNPYGFLGTTQEAVQEEVAKEEKPGIFVRLFGAVPDSKLAKAHLKQAYESFCLNPAKTEEDKKLAKRVYEMLSENKGREKYDKYIVADTKRSMPKRVERLNWSDSEDEVTAALNLRASGDVFSKASGSSEESKPAFYPKPGMKLA